MKMSSLLNPSPSSSSGKQKVCQICDRTFANGKAMGGHMRAHLAKLPLPSKPNPIPPPTSHNSSVQTNPNSIITSKSSSSDDNSLSDKEVALCLLKLMADAWPNGVKPVIRFPLTRECKRRGGFKSFVVDEDEDEDEEKEDDDVPFSVTRSRRINKKSRGKYKCAACPRVFRSSQALGGHRASHENKRMKISWPDPSSSEFEVGRSAGFRRIFKCPYCDKVFGSGQALGGHKKVHLSYLEMGKTSKSADQNVPTRRNNTEEHAVFDLNLPAPVEY